MIYTDIYSKTNYISPIGSYRGYIKEYDLSKANISALLYYKAIDKKLYDYLANSEKQFREVYIGNMIKKNPDMYTIINNGIVEAKRLLFDTNNIKEENVLAIHNDAVYIMSEKDLRCEFGLLKFRVKNIFTFYMKTLNGIQLFYRFDRENNNDIIDVKGIGDDTLYKHQQLFLEFLMDIFYNIENSNILDTIGIYNQYVDAYLHRNLPIENYREFNASNMFRITAGDQMYLLPELNDNYISAVDINFNYGILRDLSTIIYQMYFQSINKL